MIAIAAAAALAAVIFIPADHPDDGKLAEQCQAYAARRGYLSPAPIVRHWNLVLRLIHSGWAQVVIVAHADHRREVAARTEVVEQELGRDRERENLKTVVILANRQTGSRYPVGRHRTPETARRHANQRPTPPRKRAEQLIDDTMRRWAMTLWQPDRPRVHNR